MTFRRWDIVLLPFPFTNLNATKKRPALVISPNEYNSGPDLVVMFVTSNLKARSKIGDYIIQEWEESGLPKPSMTRMKFATIDKTLAIKKIAELTGNDQAALKLKLQKFLGI
ncbi:MULTISPECIES: type II toxin-antitoxin system PemK/MazF family toxin [Gracilimonas]|uniref:Type II toxin-antitoxin system PemK/MazF family toxin n=1 Tax=Gracilimonas sediminicola TaxID=2952158 RepID=A0A9X2L2A4_9BACT|nr:type II toxin-antitoxin system PemK/MazF family toxin [Gracilimonas sediminicola]MCP9290987.1 type II toxin-antitoxin system PemK/MazF family toxin [Gracilimonas sediminicola]